MDSEMTVEDECRICRSVGNEETPLFNPCACRGSLKYVHQDCLFDWFDSKKTMECEICLHKVSFGSVYVQDTPSRLPMKELFLGMISILFPYLHSFVSPFVIALSMCLLLVPFTNYWIWQFSFVSSKEAQKLFIGRVTLGILLMEWGKGILLTICNTCVLFFIISVREKFFNLQEARNLEEELDLDPNDEPYVDLEVFADIEDFEDFEDFDYAELDEDLGDDDNAEFLATVIERLVEISGIKNAIIFLVYNALILALGVLFPFTVGRVVMSTFFTSRFAVSRSVDAIGDLRFKDSMSMIVFISSQAMCPPNGTDMNIVPTRVAPLLAIFSTVALGYSVILLALSSCVGLGVVIGYNQRDPLALALIHCVSRMVEAAMVSFHEVLERAEATPFFVVQAMATTDHVRQLIASLRADDMDVVLMQVSKWSAIVAKSCVLLFLSIFVIPIGVGLLLNLIFFLPFQVPIGETPAFFMIYDDRILNLHFLGFLATVVVLMSVTERWQARFEQVRNDGFANLQGFWVLKEIVAPILTRLFIAILVPNLLGGFLFPYLSNSSMANAAVYRFSWLGCFVCFALLLFMIRTRRLLLDVRNSIRDDRYLVGRKLHNFGEKE